MTNQIQNKKVKTKRYNLKEKNNQIWQGYHRICSRFIQNSSQPATYNSISPFRYKYRR